MSIAKNIKVIVISFFIIFFFTQSRAELKIVFVNMDKVMKESAVGKSLLQQLDKADSKNKKFSKNHKKILLQKETKLLHKKIFYLKKSMKKKLSQLIMSLMLFKKMHKRK